MLATRTGMVAVSGMRSAAFRSGGQRRFGLYDSGVDPTDTPTARQFFGRETLTGEERLLEAQLLLALHDARKYVGDRTERGRTLFADALAWFDRTDWSWPLSFVVACERFHLSPSAVRSCLHRELEQRRRDARQALRAARLTHATSPGPAVMPVPAPAAPMAAAAPALG